MKLALRVIAVLAATAAGIYGFRLFQANLAYKAAMHGFQQGDLSAAQTNLREYLAIQSGDHQARMMLAEALITNQNLDIGDTAIDAVSELNLIPDESSFAAEARLRAARLKFFILDAPAAAERLLKKSIDINPDLYESHYIMWRLLGLTGRTDFCEPYFWKAYELAPEGDRPGKLSEWYMNQFAPRTSNVDLDRRMGFLAPLEATSSQSELRRLNTFRESEPESAVLHAAVARWYLREGVPRRALTVLNDALEPTRGMQDGYFVATLIATHIELGNFEQAKTAFQEWPEPRDGYEYWKWAGQIADEVERDRVKAADAYEKAIAIWPGHFDWSLHFRRAHCLSLIGKTDEAEKQRTQAKLIEQLMERGVHIRIRKALAKLDNPAELETLVEFYNDIQRSREADEWRRFIDSIAKK